MKYLLLIISVTLYFSSFAQTERSKGIIISDEDIYEEITNNRDYKDFLRYSIKEWHIQDSINSIIYKKSINSSYIDSIFFDFIIEEYPNIDKFKLIQSYIKGYPIVFNLSPISNFSNITSLEFGGQNGSLSYDQVLLTSVYPFNFSCICKLNNLQFLRVYSPKPFSYDDCLFKNENINYLNLEPLVIDYFQIKNLANKKITDIHISNGTHEYEYIVNSNYKEIIKSITYLNSDTTPQFIENKKLISKTDGYNTIVYTENNIRGNEYEKGYAFKYKNDKLFSGRIQNTHYYENLTYLEFFNYSPHIKLYIAEENNNSYERFHIWSIYDKTTKELINVKFNRGYYKEIYELPEVKIHPDTTVYSINKTYEKAVYRKVFKDNILINKTIITPFMFLTVDSSLSIEKLFIDTISFSKESDNNKLQEYERYNVFKKGILKIDTLNSGSFNGTWVLYDVQEDSIYEIEIEDEFISTHKSNSKNYFYFKIIENKGALLTMYTIGNKDAICYYFFNRDSFIKWNSEKEIEIINENDYHYNRLSTAYNSTPKKSKYSIRKYLK